MTIKSIGGFTLVELLLVMIIIGILAAISFPTMSNVSTRAELSEAVAALGNIRSIERIYYTENYKYVAAPYGSITDIPGINPGDLNGAYFDEDSYSVTVGSDQQTFYIYCVVETGSGCSRFTLPNGYIRMNGKGMIETRNIPSSGYPEY